ncbi:hypothetical protein WG66_002522 [Moniliophthora roreri]|uniref:CFEM domain-containing protein n=1 Tax=Moniliophthora roreri TaxID=221103 RepID=A0A0W0FEJ0_MONRR|nr:hypothetical protein WG66_002522 [Moniliophthora roreri]
MRLRTLLFIALGTALTVVAKNLDCITKCANAGYDKSPCTHPKQENFHNCLCNDETFVKQVKDCFVASNCNSKDTQQALEYHNKECAIYKQKETYTGENCVKACEWDYYPDTECKSANDWDCLCKSTQYPQDIAWCAKDSLCTPDAVKKWMEYKGKKCGKSKGGPKPRELPNQRKRHPTLLGGSA